MSHQIMRAGHRNGVAAVVGRYVKRIRKGNKGQREKKNQVKKIILFNYFNFFYQCPSWSLRYKDHVRILHKKHINLQNGKETFSNK